MSAAAEKALNFRTPTPAEINAVKEEFGLSSIELGRALGFDDGGRAVRGWITGERHGVPNAPSQSASACFWYFVAIRRALADGEQFFGPQAIGHLKNALPRFLK